MCVAGEWVLNGSSNQSSLFKSQGNSLTDTLKDGSRATVNVNKFLKSKVVELLDSMLFRCKSSQCLQQASKC